MSGICMRYMTAFFIDGMIPSEARNCFFSLRPLCVC